MTGNIEGFAVPLRGAVAPTAVQPPPLPSWWRTAASMPVSIELSWTPDTDGSQLIRTFQGEFGSPLEAYLTACCLWSSFDTGRGAIAAAMAGPDGARWLVGEMASTCGRLDPARVAAVKATARDAVDLTPAAARGQLLTFADLHHSSNAAASAQPARLERP